MQDDIVQFLCQKHIVSFMAEADGEMWSASCFYVFDQKRQRLILLTSPQTRHGKLMLKNPRISGTVINESCEVMKLQGIQFLGEITPLKTVEKPTALEQYYARFPYARLMPSTAWQIVLKEVKFTDNSAGFGHKTVWKCAEE